MSLLFRRFATTKPWSVIAKEPLGLHNLTPTPGTTKERKRCRGIANGGRTHGRGHKGQLSRSGPGIPRGFEGGQTPFYKLFPKVKKSQQNERDFQKVSLDRIQHLINTERLDASKPITIKHLYEAGIKDFKNGIIVTPGVASFLTTPITLYATEFSPEAIKRIEEIGGKAVAFYHTPLGFRALIHPEKFLRPIRFAAPILIRDLMYYWSYENRGYLHPEIMKNLSQDETLEFNRYVIAKRGYHQDQLDRMKENGEDISDKPLVLEHWRRA